MSFMLRSKMKRMEREMMPSASPEVLSCLPIVPMAKVFPGPGLPVRKHLGMSVWSEACQHDSVYS